MTGIAIVIIMMMVMTTAIIIIITRQHEHWAICLRGYLGLVSRFWVALHLWLLYRIEYTGLDLGDAVARLCFGTRCKHILTT